MTLEKDFLYFTNKKFYEHIEKNPIPGIGPFRPSKYCPPEAIKEFNEEALFILRIDLSEIIYITDYIKMKEMIKTPKLQIEKELSIIYPEPILKDYYEYKDNEEWLALISGKIHKKRSKLYKELVSKYINFLKLKEKEEFLKELSKMAEDDL